MCAYCRQRLPFEVSTVEHVVQRYLYPLIRAKQWWYEANMIACCSPCNQRAREAGDFRYNRLRFWAADTKYLPRFFARKRRARHWISNRLVQLGYEVVGPSWTLDGEPSQRALAVVS